MFGQLVRDIQDLCLLIRGSSSDCWVDLVSTFLFDPPGLRARAANERAFKEELEIRFRQSEQFRRG
jgi:hypothetical protein